MVQVCRTWCSNIFNVCVLVGVRPLLQRQLRVIVILIDRFTKMYVHTLTPLKSVVAVVVVESCGCLDCATGEERLFLKVTLAIECGREGIIVEGTRLSIRSLEGRHATNAILGLIGGQLLAQVFGRDVWLNERKETF